VDENKYETKIKVSDSELAAVQIERHTFHGDWNYTVHHHQIERLLRRDSLARSEAR
jgi:hypothetical protein